jgi:hypothetical protein
MAVGDSLMQSFITVTTPAKSQALLSVPEAMLGLNLSRSTDMTLHDLVEMLILWSSDQIARLAGRVFGEETVKETFYDLDSNYPDNLLLARYPVSSIESVIDSGTTLEPETDFTLDAGAGKIRCLGGNFVGPVDVTYTGGFRLPTDAPQALKQATILIAREAYYAATRGDATIRMVSHKEARIIYFDPNARSAAGAAAGGGGGTAASRAAQDLIRRFIRFPV